MRTTIVLRAENPALAAALARAIGVPLLDPDRLNPDCWHTRTPVTILVTAADGQPGITFAPNRFDEAVVKLEEAGAVSGPRSASERILDFEAAGVELRIERDAPRMRFRDITDVGSLFSIRPVFEDHRDGILRALAEIGASDPRLVGPALGRTGGSRLWTLVVDAPEDADVAGVEAFIARVGEGFAPLKVRRSTTFAPDHLAEIDQFAYDI